MDAQDITWPRLAWRTWSHQTYVWHNLCRDGDFLRPPLFLAHLTLLAPQSSDVQCTQCTRCLLPELQQEGWPCNGCCSHSSTCHDSRSATHSINIHVPQASLRYGWQQCTHSSSVWVCQQDMLPSMRAAWHLHVDLYIIASNESLSR